MGCSVCKREIKVNVHSIHQNKFTTIKSNNLNNLEDLNNNNLNNSNDDNNSKLNNNENNVNNSNYNENNNNNKSNKESTKYQEYYSCKNSNILESKCNYKRNNKENDITSNMNLIESKKTQSFLLNDNLKIAHIFLLFAYWLPLHCLG